MNEKIKESMRFYLMASRLKEKIRSGWNDEHWDIKGRRESIADHVYGTCILAISIYSNLDLKIDFNKVIKMLVLHEIGEVLIGDITPYDNVTADEKMKIEHEAWIKIIGDLTDKKKLYDLLMEFDSHETNESKFAYMCDKLEADIQAKIYQDEMVVHKLSDKVNNKLFQSNKLKEAIDNGDKKMFDVWYRYDKDKYDDLFLSILNYIKEIDTSVI